MSKRPTLPSAATERAQCRRKSAYQGTRIALFLVTLAAILACLVLAATRGDASIPAAVICIAAVTVGNLAITALLDLADCILATAARQRLEQLMRQQSAADRHTT